MARKADVKAPGTKKSVTVPTTIPWGRQEFNAQPDFIPGKNTVKHTPGNPEEQLEEAFRLVKAKSKTLETNDSLSKYKDKMDALDVGDAIEFLEACSDYERQAYLDAENASRQRREVLRHFGR